MPNEAAELDAALLDERRTTPTRYKVRFPNEEAMNAALAAESPGANIAVISHRRRVVSLDVPTALAAELSDSFLSYRGNFGAEITEDYKYALEDLDFFNPLAFNTDDVTQPSLDDVVQQIQATAAWTQARGSGVIVAVVDTGIDGTRPEFPASKRHAQSWAPAGENPWTDWQGHGSMCATIAAGTKADGGTFDGVAPDAAVLSCRTHFYDTELAVIYDLLSDLARAGNIVVASNSFGIQTGSPPPVPANSDFLPALDDAIAAGVYVFFSAGNYHQLAGGLPDGHTPNTVWLHKGRADVFAVGAAKPDSSMWYYSSRGPGQFFGAANTSQKPDVVGVTPPNGRVVFGASVKVMADGWGTSGCCPQAAGLAALMLSKARAQGSAMPSHATLFETIRGTCVSLSHHAYAQGTGMLNCAAAVSAI